MSRSGQRITAIVALVVALVVGLVIGLTIGGRGHSHPSSVSGSTTSTTAPSTGATVPPTPTTLPSGITPVAPAALPAPVTGALVETVPSSVASNCSVDVTVPLDEWLKTVPDDSTVMFPSGSCYQVNGSLAVENKHQVVLDGEGVRIVETTARAPVLPLSLYPSAGGRSARQGVRIDNSTDVTLKGFSLQSVDTAGSYDVPLANEDGVQTTYSDRVLLEGMTISDFHGDGVAVTNASQNVTIEQVNIPLSGRNSLSVYFGSEVTIEDNQLGSCHFVHVDVEPFPVGGVPRSAQNILVTHNSMTGSGSFFSDLGSQSAVINNIEVSYNTASRAISVEVGAGIGAIGVMRHNIEVIGNHGNDVSNGGLRGLMCFTNVQGLVVSGNYQRFNGRGGAIAVEVSNSGDINEDGNWFPGAVQLLNTSTQSVTLSAAASAGQNHVSTRTPPVDLKAYIIGTGTEAETIDVLTYSGHGPFILMLGQSLKKDHPAGEHLVTAPSTNYQQTNNSVNTTSAPAQWSSANG